MEKTPLAVQMAAGCAQLSRALLTAFQRLLLPREGTGAGGGMPMAMAVLGTLWCGVGEQGTGSCSDTPWPVLALGYPLWPELCWWPGLASWIILPRTYIAFCRKVSIQMLPANFKKQWAEAEGGFCRYFTISRFEKHCRTSPPRKPVPVLLLPHIIVWYQPDLSSFV